VFQIRQTERFAKWLISLRDVRAKARILARLDSVRLGNLGDSKTLGDGVSEFRIDVGAGYRVYYTRRHRVVVILLCGGDKSTQNKDIARAKLLARQLNEE
jgi:putative addiction module killer protein